MTPPEALRVRPAVRPDVAEILPMVGAICAMHDRLDPSRYGMLPDVVDRYARWLPERAEDPSSVFLVAEAGPTRRLAGFLIATVEASIPIYSLERFGFIHDVWVEPDDRRRGLAGLLVEAACARFCEMGLAQVRLETAYANEDARRLFERCGFRTATIDMLRTLPPR